MSQQKVDYHKEQKRNRRQIMAKEKRIRRLEITLLIVILAAVIIWFCYLLYSKAQADNAANIPVETNDLDLSAWEDYTNELDAMINSGSEAAEEAAENAAEETAEEAAEEPAEEAAETAEEPAEETAEEAGE